MLKKENSTSSSTGATVTCLVPANAVQLISDGIDCRNGMLAKALAGKHLSALLMSKIESLVGDGKGKPGGPTDTRAFLFSESGINELQWLVAEVWEISQDLSKQVDELTDSFTDIADAAYLALKEHKASTKGLSVGGSNAA